MMRALTIKDIISAKGERQLSFVQVAREEEAIAASQAGMDMIGTAFIPERAEFAKAVPNTHFQYGLPWG
jgi:3-methyl-2-oxobutanoate hydroxymethyltransferase